MIAQVGALVFFISEAKVGLQSAVGFQSADALYWDRRRLACTKRAARKTHRGRRDACGPGKEHPQKAQVYIPRKRRASGNNLEPRRQDSAGARPNHRQSSNNQDTRPSARLYRVTVGQSASSKTPRPPA